MILGVGTDIVQIPRVERLIDKFGDKFLSRILSAEEKEVYALRGCRAFVARRIAAKEAISKALGTGIGRPIRFRDITVINNTLGKPEVKIAYRDEAHIFVGANKPQISISLSDDYPIAIAFVVISA